MGKGIKNVPAPRPFLPLEGTGMPLLLLSPPLSDCCVFFQGFPLVFLSPFFRPPLPPLVSGARAIFFGWHGY